MAQQQIDVSRQLHIQMEAAQALLANIKDIIGDDEEMAADAVEGETRLLDVIRDAIIRVGELEAMVEGLKLHSETLAKRKHRLEEQASRIRTAICSAMEVGSIKKLELDVATATQKPVPPKAEVTDEAAVPSRFWKPQPPKLDKKAVLDALKAKEEVPGCVLSNGGTTVSIRFC
jgi:hypothetical protein